MTPIEIIQLIAIIEIAWIISSLRPLKFEKTKEFDSKPCKLDETIKSKLNDYTPLEVANIETEHIHSITWNAQSKEREVTDIEFRNLL